MRRAVWLALLIGALAASGLAAMAWLNVAVLPSYLAAWLCCMAAPLGALPLALGFEAAGLLYWPLMPVLRRLLLLLPIGACPVLPLLLGAGSLFRRSGIAGALPPHWMAPGFFAGRTVAILLVLSLLALVFSLPSARGPRRLLAAMALFLYVCLMSVAAVDWLLALQPGLGSSAIGLLLVAAQVGVASAVAAFALAVASRADAAMPGGVATLLGVVLAGWAFLQFVQFLVVWSANLPAEIVWYQVRMTGGGSVVVWFAVVATALALAVLSTPLARRPVVLACVGGMLLAMHLAAIYWLVTPAVRGRFVVTLPDLLALFGLGGLGTALFLALMHRGAAAPARTAEPYAV